VRDRQGLAVRPVHPSAQRFFDLLLRHGNYRIGDPET
jgi:hypothetical protein